MKNHLLFNQPSLYKFHTLDNLNRYLSSGDQHLDRPLLYGESSFDFDFLFLSYFPLFSSFARLDIFYINMGVWFNFFTQQNARCGGFVQHDKTYIMNCWISRIKKNKWRLLFAIVLLTWNEQSHMKGLTTF